MTPSSFRDAFRRRGVLGTSAITLLLIAARSADRIDAQNASTAPDSLRLSIQSGLEAVGGSARAAAEAQGGTRVGAEMEHVRRTPRNQLRLWGDVRADQQWQNGSPHAIAAEANIASSVTLSRRSRLQFGGRFSSAPTDLFASLGSVASGGSSASGGPAASAAVTPNGVGGSELLNVRTLSFNGDVALTRTLGAHSEASFSGSQYVSTSAGEHVKSSAGAARVSRRVGRLLAWRAVYAFTTSEASSAGAPRIENRQDLNVGIDIGRPLSALGNSSLTVTTGTSLLTTRDGRRARLNTAARLDCRLTRRWSLNADYSRPIEYVAGLAQPLVADATRIGAAGSLPRRIGVAVFASAAIGSLGMNGVTRFASYTGVLQASRRLGPAWQMEAEYHDGWYRFDVPPGSVIPAAFTRRGFRAGLTWAPATRW